MRGVDFSGPWPEIMRLAARISGTPRYLSVHPGGVIANSRRSRPRIPLDLGQ
jgi:DNA polymerase III alpha subunit